MTLEHCFSDTITRGASRLAPVAFRFKCLKKQYPHLVLGEAE